MKKTLCHTLGYKKAYNTELRWQILPYFLFLRLLWRTVSKEHWDVLAIWWQSYGIIG